MTYTRLIPDPPEDMRLTELLKHVNLDIALKQWEAFEDELLEEVSD